MSAISDILGVKPKQEGQPVTPQANPQYPVDWQNGQTSSGGQTTPATQGSTNQNYGQRPAVTEASLASNPPLNIPQSQLYEPQNMKTATQLYAQKYGIPQAAQQTTPQATATPPTSVDETPEQAYNRVLNEKGEAPSEAYKAQVNSLTELNNYLNETLDRLKRTKEKEERENLRREFSANVSHELKTPLTSISGIAEIIKNGIVDEKDVKTFAGKIYDEARRLIHLVEDIIKLSQLDEGEQAVEKTPIDIYDLSRIEIHHLEPVAEERHIKINLQGEHMMISGIHSVLEEMVYNLIENAIKYNKEDGSIDVTVKKKKHRCEFCVKDSGIGIPADQLDRIFERFYRVDKSHSKEIGGTGLGLSIVKHGAKLHNAEIKIESALNVGTEIKLIFPV